jgi:hypothetical protein
MVGVIGNFIDQLSTLVCEWLAECAVDCSSGPLETLRVAEGQDG